MAVLPIHERPFPLRSRSMRALFDELEGLRESDCTVLITGETGTGKSMLARRIHDIGARSRGRFVDVNCAGLAGDFVQSELFGHERGAFTGAHASKDGLLDAAHGGTLFLDEIGDMDIRVQAKVLKVLEEKRFRRMGDHREREVDIRLVAATHHDLHGAVERRTFREDLYYRVSTVTLHVPPLRERRDDILPIAAEMLSRLSGRRYGEGCELAAGAAERLLDHDWPGNLRELKNVLERALVRPRPNGVILEEDIRFDNPRRSGQRVSARLLGEGAREATRGEIEEEHIRIALAAEKGRIIAAARRLGISRSTLYLKLKQYGITPDRRR